MALVIIPRSLRCGNVFFREVLNLLLQGITQITGEQFLKAIVIGFMGSVNFKKQS